jgi:ribosomal-protein-alanine N-acetyltransferase
MTSAILYRWRLKPGRDDAFRAAWTEGTKRIHKACGSYGACLHRGEDGIYWSYAVWPSEETRRGCFDGHDWFAQDCFKTMQDCIEERFDEVRLTVTDNELDLRKPAHVMPVLTTERLVLRRIAREDADRLYPALSDENNMRYWSCGPLDSVDAVRDYLSWNIDGAGVQCFAVAAKETPELALGWVILMDRKAHEAELGYMFRPDAHGRGYASEATKSVIEHAFRTRGFIRVYADVDPDNSASLKMLDGLEFQQEGRLRGSWNTHIGLRDSLLLSKLADD